MERRSRRVLQQPPAVVKRWVRFKVVAWAPAVARKIFRWRSRLTRFRRKRALEGAFNEVKNRAIRLENSPFRASFAIANLALYILLAERDIETLKVDALSHQDEWTRKLCARVILLTIHELHLDKVTGQTLRDAMEEIGASDEARKEVAVALREIRSVQEKVRKEFVAIRNSAITHRDPNALLQYRSIRNLRVDRVFSVAAEFYAASDRFVGLVPKLMIQSSSPTGLLRQFLATEEQK